MGKSCWKFCHPRRGGSVFSFAIHKSYSLLSCALWSHHPCAQWGENVLSDQIGPECFSLCLPRALRVRGMEDDSRFSSLICFVSETLQRRVYAVVGGTDPPTEWSRCECLLAAVPAP